MTVSIAESLYPTADLIPFMACCCMVTSCYLGGQCQGCQCEKKDEGHTIQGPSIQVQCCTCCKVPCYGLKCCKMGDSNCCKVQVNINFQNLFYSFLRMKSNALFFISLVLQLHYLLLLRSTLRHSHCEGGSLFAHLFLHYLLF
jgi:hypothetical protein